MRTEKNSGLNMDIETPGTLMRDGAGEFTSIDAKNLFKKLIRYTGLTKKNIPVEKKNFCFSRGLKAFNSKQCAKNN